MGENNPTNNERGLMKKFPVIANLLIIFIIAILGLWIAYFATAIFTKHGEETTVPGVENMSYTQAIAKLHEYGFRTEIRDSLFRDDIKPGFVIEQFPKANSIVKPGRKIFLYINAVSPKMIVIDDDNNPSSNALQGFPLRQALARLEELGVKNISIMRVRGESDRVIKITANGKIVKKTQKIPRNAKVVVEVSDGSLQHLRDSLLEAELAEHYYIPEPDLTSIEEPEIIPDEIPDE